jgi:hypothetical protein
LKNWQNDKIHKKHLKNVQVLFIMEEKQKVRKRDKEQ